MIVTVFCNYEETLIVGTNKDGSLTDAAKTLFGTDSGRNIEDYYRHDVDIEDGEVIHVENKLKVDASIFKP